MAKDALNGLFGPQESILTDSGFLALRMKVALVEDLITSGDDELWADLFDDTTDEETY